jgi:plasmid stabilization system protein ParE
MAEGDLDEIYGYISTKLFAEIAAINLMDKIKNDIKRLTRFNKIFAH